MVGVVGDVVGVQAQQGVRRGRGTGNKSKAAADIPFRWLRWLRCGERGAGRGEERRSGESGREVDGTECCSG